MRSTLLSAALMASLITPALAQTGMRAGCCPAAARGAGAKLRAAHHNAAAGRQLCDRRAARQRHRHRHVPADGQPAPATSTRQDTRSQIAPNLPSPQVGPNASPVDYLRAAQGALSAGQTGEAQQALEEAQTRLLDRSVPYGQTNNPSDNPAVAQITQALHALAAGDRGQCMQLIQSAIPAAQAMAE